MKAIIKSLALTSFVFLSLQTMAHEQDSFTVICDKRVEFSNFTDFSAALGHESMKVINQHIDNYEFEAIEGTFVSCGDLSHGVGWVGDFKINNTTKTLGYFVKF